MLATFICPEFFRYRTHMSTPRKVALAYDIIEIPIETNASGDAMIRLYALGGFGSSSVAWLAK